MECVFRRCGNAGGGLCWGCLSACLRGTGKAGGFDSIAFGKQTDIFFTR